LQVRKAGGYIKLIHKEMKDTSISKKTRPYINPYLGGVLLGLVLLSAFYIAGRGLGASGAVKSLTVSAVKTISPRHAENGLYYKEYLDTHPGNPLRNWLIFQTLGVFAGGFLSGALSGRLKFKVEHSPGITSKKRLLLALIGGVLFGLGSEFGRGCTSGSALSGMAVLSLGGIITMMAIFGTGFVLAYFFRKNWIKF
jgi:uncharacterized membrane protein YedE/YeeE